MVFLSSLAPAATIFAASDAGSSSMFSHLGITLVLAFLPILAIAATSFIKIALVIAILRSALGAQGVPSNMVITALAAVLSIFVMAPVGNEMLTILETVPPLSAAVADQFGISQARTLFETAGAPLVEFLRLNASAGEIDYFSGLAGEVVVAEPGMRILLPAFTVGEVTEAFVIGVLIYIPFVVIDLIVGSTLLALGMHMLSPGAISLPLKLLLFVSVDGWHVLLDGLLVTYST